MTDNPQVQGNENEAEDKKARHARMIAELDEGFATLREGFAGFPPEKIKLHVRALLNLYGIEAPESDVTMFAELISNNERIKVAIE